MHTYTYAYAPALSPGHTGTGIGTGAILIAGVGRHLPCRLTLLPSPSRLCLALLPWLCRPSVLAVWALALTLALALALALALLALALLALALALAVAFAVLFVGDSGPPPGTPI